MPQVHGLTQRIDKQEITFEEAFGYASSAGSKAFFLQHRPVPSYARISLDNNITVRGQESVPKIRRQSTCRPAYSH